LRLITYTYSRTTPKKKNKVGKEKLVRGSKRKEKERSRKRRLRERKG
jgi:hypothetical protein